MAVTILLVEDNELNRDMLSQRLKRRGFDVNIAIDGQEGFLLAKSTQPGLILMDMSLPVLDGWTVIKQLKSCKETSKIPIIALSAHAMVGDKEKVLQAGFDDYETKPIEFPSLLEKIQNCLANNQTSEH